MARPCRNLHQSTLTKGRKKPSSLNPPSFLAWLPTWKHHRGSAYHCEAIWLLSMRGQQPYPLLNSPWSSWGACLPLLGCLRPGSKQGGERPANTIATGQRWGKSHSKNRTQGHVPWQSAEDMFWKPPSQQPLWWLIRVGDGLSMARRGHLACCKGSSHLGFHLSASRPARPLCCAHPRQLGDRFGCLPDEYSVVIWKGDRNGAQCCAQRHPLARGARNNSTLPFAFKECYDSYVPRVEYQGYFLTQKINFKCL